MSVWEQLDESSNIQGNDKPIWAIDPLNKKHEKSTLKWLLNDYNGIRQEDYDRVEEILRHYKLYKGLSADRMHRSDNSDGEISRAQTQRKIVINHLYDATEYRVSAIAKYRPAVQFLPANDEFHDKQASKLAAQLFDYLKYINDFDLKAQSQTRNTLIAGAGYLFVEWDKDSGPESPIYRKAKEEAGGEEITVKDSQGNPVKDESGKTVKIKKAVNIGEVKFSLVNYEKLFFQRFDPGTGDSADYFYRVERKPVYEIRADYPEKADEIKESKDAFNNEYYKYNSLDIKNTATVISFYHKPTKYFPKGCFIKFTDDVILESIEYPYEHGMFPFAHMTDIDIPNEMHPRSNYVNLRQINAQINNLITMKMRNIKLMSSPKWMVPKGSVKLDQLNNNTGIVQYQGPIRPEIAKYNTTPNEVNETKQELKEDFNQISGYGGVSQGNPPPGVTSGVALQYLQEQEHNRHNGFVQKYNKWVRQVADLSLKTASQYYDETDERLILVLGKNEEYSRVPFDPKTLASAFDIRIQNSSALPESKAQKIQTVMDLSERFPGLVSQEQVADMIDIGQSGKWYSEASAATRTAERENELFFDGKPREAQEWEFHIQHWTVHVKEMQKPGFLDLPEEVQENFQDHIRAHEMMMMNKIAMNPAFAQQMQMLPDFPLLFVPDQVAPQPNMEPMAPEAEGHNQEAMAQEMNAREDADAEVEAEMDVIPTGIDVETEVSLNPNLIPQ